MQATTTVEIDCPIEEVFHAANDQVPEWSRVVVGDEVVLKTADGVGTTFKSTTESHGRQMVFDGKVLVWNPPFEAAVELIGRQFDIAIRNSFEEVSPEKTRVTQDSKVFPKGGLKIFFFLFGWLMNKANCREAENEMLRLKAFCESKKSRTDPPS